MIIGVPKEIKDNENRVAISPAGIDAFVEAGHEVLIETGAGEGSGFFDEVFIEHGAKIAQSAEEVWSSAEMVLKVKEPQPSEYRILSRGSHFIYLSAPGRRTGTDTCADGEQGDGDRLRNHSVG